MCIDVHIHTCIHRITFPYMYYTCIDIDLFDYVSTNPQRISQAPGVPVPRATGLQAVPQPPVSRRPGHPGKPRLFRSYLWT